MHVVLFKTKCLLSDRHLEAAVTLYKCNGCIREVALDNFVLLTYLYWQSWLNGDLLPWVPSQKCLFLNYNVLASKKQKFCYYYYYYHHHHHCYCAVTIYLCMCPYICIVIVPSLLSPSV